MTRAIHIGSGVDSRVETPPRLHPRVETTEGQRVIATAVG
jgi:hypothetical protein